MVEQFCDRAPSGRRLLQTVARKSVTQNEIGNIRVATDDAVLQIEIHKKKYG